jgi:hypothetical protein
VRVRTPYRVIRVRHGIEWPQVQREFIDDEIIDAMLLFDDATQPLLVGSTVFHSHSLSPRYTSERLDGDSLDIIQLRAVHAVLH